MSRLRATAVPAAIVASIALLAGCGTTSAPTDASPTAASGDGEPIVLVDGEGTEVTLDAPAERIVALEWAQAEILTSLGANLVGVADVTGYESWVGTAVPLTGDPADVGVRTEPSVETIADLEPDLIVGVPRSVPDAVRGQLESIAPVVLFENADASDPLATVEHNLTMLASASGADERGEELIAELHDALRTDAAAISDAGLDGAPAVFTSPYSDGSTVSIRMHGPGSAPQAVLSALGLAVAWDDEGDAAYGLSNTDIEGLTALPDDAWFLYWANGDSDDPVDTALSGNAVWDNLAFVQDGRVAGVGDGVWLYGGPESLIAFSNDVVATLTAG